MTTEREHLASRSASWWRPDNAALGAFVAYLLVAFVVLMSGGLGHRWFFRDDYFFLVGRKAGSLHDLFAAHNQHWSTVPVLVFRALWATIGMRSYVPYLACIVILHLAAATLLRAVMRRCDVQPWLATAAAAAFVLFGPGSVNIQWAFQIGFVAALDFGLVQLLLSDHEGPIDWRDGAALGSGALALMSSGVGVAMVFVTGLAVLARRGLRAAALQVAPLAAAYLAWQLTVHPKPTIDAGRPTLDVMFRWLRSAVTGSFVELGRFRVVGVALALVLIAGFVLAFRSRGAAAMRGAAATPLAMLAGGLLFAATTGWTRWFLGSSAASASRYVYILVAFLLPAIAFAANELARRWRLATPVLAVLLLLGVPGNIGRFDEAPFNSRYFANQRRIVTAAVTVPFARSVPRDVRPFPDGFMPRSLDIGWMLDARRDGKLPAARLPIDPQITRALRVRLGFAQRFARDDGARCPVLTSPREIHPPRGTSYTFAGRLVVRQIDAGESGPSFPFASSDGSRLTAELDGLRLRVLPAPSLVRTRLCVPSSG